MQLLGEDLDLRRITWRLPPETIPRLSGSSRLSSDTEGLLHEEDSDVATGSLRRSGTPRPQAGEGRLRYSTECPVSSCSELRGWRLGSAPVRVPFLPLCCPSSCWRDALFTCCSLLQNHVLVCLLTRVSR